MRPAVVQDGNRRPPLGYLQATATVFPWGETVLRYIKVCYKCACTIHPYPRRERRDPPVIISVRRPRLRPHGEGELAGVTH